jgi:hypothetical protein
VLVEEGGGGDVFGLVVGTHNGVGDFHVGECVEHCYLLAEGVVVVNLGWGVAAADVRDGGVVAVCEVLDSLYSLDEELILPFK